jgi:hypothetical protein
MAQVVFVNKRVTHTQHTVYSGGWPSKPNIFHTQHIQRHCLISSQRLPVHADLWPGECSQLHVPGEAADRLQAATLQETDQLAVHHEADGGGTEERRRVDEKTHPTNWRGRGRDAR